MNSEHYLGWTGEDAKLIVCPHCTTEHWYQSLGSMPIKCDVCEQSLFKEMDPEE